MAAVAFIDKNLPPEGYRDAYVRELAKKKFGNLTDDDFIYSSGHIDLPQKAQLSCVEAGTAYFFLVHVKSEKAKEIEKMGHPDFRWTAERPGGALAPKVHQFKP